MAAATKNRVGQGRIYKGKAQLPFPVKADAHVFRNTLAVVDTSDDNGIVNFGSYDADYKFVGVHELECYNSSSADKEIYRDEASVRRDGTINLVPSGFTASTQHIGRKVYAIDNQTVKLTDNTASTVDAIYVGTIVSIISTTMVEVEIDTYGPVTLTHTHA